MFIYFKPVVLSVLLCALTLCFALIMISAAVNTTVLNPDFLINLLEETNFYNILIDTLLSRIFTELPFAQLGETYIRKALTTELIVNEANPFLNAIFAFFHAETDNLPVISLYYFKDSILSEINIPNEALKMEMVEYWLGPLPDTIRLEYLTSLDIFFEVRNIFTIIKLYTFYVISFLIALGVILALLLKNIRDFILFLSSSAIASSLLILLSSIYAFRAIFYSGFGNFLNLNLIFLGFNFSILNDLLAYGTSEFIEKLAVISLSTLIVSAIVLYITPSSSTKIS